MDVEKAPQRIKELLARLDAVADMDTLSAQLDIMAAILTAESEEAVFAAANAGTLSGQDYAGRPFLILDYSIKRSSPQFTSQGGFPFYYLIRGQDLTDGKDIVLSCGGYTFVSVMDALDRLGSLSTPGGYAMVLESRTMKGSGYDVLIPHKYNPPAAKKG